MSKKQVRLNLAGILRRKDELVNQPIHLVMKNNAVHFGEIISFDKQKIIFINMMHHRLSLLLQDIREGWFDQSV